MEILAIQEQTGVKIDKKELAKLDGSVSIEPLKGGDDGDMDKAVGLDTGPQGKDL